MSPPATTLTTYGSFAKPALRLTDPNVGLSFGSCVSARLTHRPTSTATTPRRRANRLMADNFMGRLLERSDTGLSHLRPNGRAKHLREQPWARKEEIVTGRGRMNARLIHRSEEHTS